MAHRILGIEQMISIESDSKVFARADFNRPFRSIEIIKGHSGTVLPRVLARKTMRARACVVWLDYDSSLDRAILSELLHLVVELPEQSALLVTVNAQQGSYADSVDHRRLAMTELFGEELIDSRMDDSAFKGHGFMNTLADSLLNALSHHALSNGREGSFVPCIRLPYRDTANMVTVGGLLPRKVDAALFRAEVAAEDWPGLETGIIATQPLTIREVQTLSRLLPTNNPITSADVQALGFELDIEQIAAFEKHYLRYPIYAEVR